MVELNGWNSWVSIAVAAVSVFVLLAISALTSTRLRRMQAQWLRDREQENSDHSQIGALCSGAASVTAHLARIEHQLRRLAERQNRLELKDSVAQSYEHAIELVRRGATTEELVVRCGLVRDEAELLVRMYRLEKAG